jgi:hypothetical protein
MLDYQHDVIVCPYCGAEMNGSLAVTSDHRPAPGDVSICIDCAGVAFYGEGLRLRLPTIAERAELEGDPEIARAVAAVLQLRDAT